MKKWIVMACIACATSANAADVGVGISAKSDDATIYVPIDFNDTWRLEPLLHYTHSKWENGDDITQRLDTLEVGVGAFALKSIGDSMRIYYGGRLSYLDAKEDVDAPEPGFDGMDSHGLRIAPTFGFEYSFNKHLSLGGEAEWFYQDVDSSNDNHDKSTGTDTRLILRFKF